MKPSRTELFNMKPSLFVLIIGIAYMGFIIGHILGTVSGSQATERLAIKAGVAHYVADSQGNAKFEFRK